MNFNCEFHNPSLLKMLQAPLVSVYMYSQGISSLYHFQLKIERKKGKVEPVRGPGRIENILAFLWPWREKSGLIENAGLLSPLSSCALTSTPEGQFSLLYFWDLTTGWWDSKCLCSKRENLFHCLPICVRFNLDL